MGNLQEKTITVKTPGQEPYDIYLRHSFLDLPAELKKIGCEGRRICIVTESTVAPLYLEEVKAQIQKCCPFAETYIFEA